MSIASEITRLQNAKAALKSSIEAKGVTVGESATLDTYPALVDSIPTGGGEYEPICFTSLEDGNTFQLNRKISISVDGKQTWQTLAANTNSPVINTGEKIYFKATENASPISSTSTSNAYQFTTEKTCNVSGHPYSLYAKFSLYFFGNLFKDTKVVDASGLTLEEVAPKYCYSSMFYGCTSLTSAPSLPATTLAEQCYYEMFMGCTSLVTAPELPATTLANSCYYEMFRGCTSLTSAPSLPATSLAGYCYYEMFYGCTSLTSAPELPATTLAESCYYSMFYECTSLTSAPELPATKLVTYCYNSMFSGCASINYIKALFTTTPSNTYTSGWVTGVASTGTFVKNSSATWTNTGTNAVPYGWTVETNA